MRISLARAILKDAPIVVLDEATAFMDPENEEKLNAALDEITKNKDGACDCAQTFHGKKCG